MYVHELHLWICFWEIHKFHRCQLSRSGWDGTDIKALSGHPAYRHFNPLIVPLLHARRDTSTYCIVTSAIHVILVGSRGEKWHTGSKGSNRQSILRVFTCNMCLQSLVSLILLLIKATRVSFSRRGHKFFTHFAFRL